MKVSNLLIFCFKFEVDIGENETIAIIQNGKMRYRKISCNVDISLILVKKGMAKTNKNK
jgi:hypothetical protein